MTSARDVLTTKSSFFSYVDAQSKNIFGRQAKTMALVLIYQNTTANYRLNVFSSCATVRSAGSQLREKKQPGEKAQTVILLRLHGHFVAR